MRLVEMNGDGWRWMSFVIGLLFGLNMQASLADSCYQNFTPIHSIQGNTSRSQYEGKRVTTQGVVTASFLGKNKLDGFFIQEVGPKSDSNPDTSEGLFVYMPHLSQEHRKLIVIGNRLQLTGRIREHFGMTQLERVANLALCSEKQKVEAIPLELPVASLEVLEQLEGMKVAGKQWIIIDHYNAHRYGEILVSNQRHSIPTQVNPPSRRLSALGITEKNALLIDDGSTRKQSKRLALLPIMSLDKGLPRLGDFVDVEGVVAYGFDRYRIHPTQVMQVSKRNPLSGVCKKKGKIRVASINLKNYFNGKGKKKSFPNERGSRSLQEFVRQTEKIVAAITRLDADVIGLIELENDGVGKHSAIASLVTAINKHQSKGLHYDWVKPQMSLGDDVIQVGLLYRKQRLALKEQAKTLAKFPFEMLNRQPILQQFVWRNTRNNKMEFAVVVNHFKAKGGCPPKGADRDQRDGQGCWNWRREQGSMAITKWLKSDTSLAGGVIIMGDFNAYRMESPITHFVESGYIHALDPLGEGAYTYVFKGEMGALDHIFISQALKDSWKQSCVWHVNSDEMRIQNYEKTGKSREQRQKWVKRNPSRFSDHDPVFIDLF